MTTLKRWEPKPGTRWLVKPGTSKEHAMTLIATAAAGLFLGASVTSAALLVYMRARERRRLPPAPSTSRWH